MAAARSQVATTGDELERLILIITKVAVALVFLTPLVVMADPLPPTFFPFVVGKAIYSRIVIEIALALWLVLFLRSPAYRLRSSWLIPILATYVAVVLVASLVGVSPQRSLWSTYERMQGFVDIAHWLAFVVVLTSVYRNWNDWKVLLNVNLGISCFIGILGLGQFLDIKLLSYLSDADRIDISFGNATYVGAYMLVNVAVASGLLARSLAASSQPATPSPTESRGRQRRRRRARNRTAREDETVSTETLLRAFWIFAIVLDVLVMILSGTRGAVIGLGVGLMAMAVAYLAWGHFRPVRIAAIALIAVVVGLFLITVVVRDTAAFKAVADGNYLLARISKIGPGDRALVERLNTASIGMRAFAARPLLGWGPENFTVGFDRYVTPDIIGGGRVVSFDQAHNKLIEELTTKGLGGFLVYMAIWVYMMWVIARKVRVVAPHDQLLVLFVGAGLVGYFVQNLFLFDTPGTVTQYFLLLGFVVFLDAAPEDRELANATSADSTTRPDGGTESQQGFLGTDLSLLVGLFVSGVFAVLFINFINLAPLKGSRTIIQTLDPSISWQDRLVLYEEAINAAPPLANYPRQVMFNQLAQNWNNMTPDEQILAAEVADRQGEAGLKAEPEEWRIYFALAGLYQKVRSLDPIYLERARELTNETERLSPNRIETHRLLAAQALTEGDPDTAWAAVRDYLTRNPDAAGHFVETNRAVANQFIARNDLATAQKVVDTYLDVDPELVGNYVQTYQRIAQQYLATNNPTTTRQVIDAFLVTSPQLAANFVDIYQQIAEQYLAANDFAAAGEVIETFVGKNPGLTGRFVDIQKQVDVAAGGTPEETGS